MRKYRNLEERILANTVREGECWIWIGRRSNSGYGVITLRWKSGPRKGKVRTALAHRIVLQVFKGHRMTPRSVAMHLCDNKLCCNPEHLHKGRQKDNVRDCVTKGRHRSPFKGASK